MPGVLSLLDLNCENSVAPQTRVHQRRWFRSADPASDPDRYFSIVTELIQAGLQIGRKMVINTCGWVEGLGAHLIEGIAARLPDTAQVVVLEGNKTFDVQLPASRWVTKIKGDLALQTNFQKGSITRNKRLWDHVTGRPAWSPIKTEKLSLENAEWLSLKTQPAEPLNLQAVVCVDAQNQFKWCGFVVDVNLKDNQAKIVSKDQASISDGDALELIDPKLCGVHSQ